MKELAWLDCQRPEPMLRFLGGRSHRRKLRLFACACCRRVWPCLNRADAAYRQGVLASERYADGLISHSELVAAQPDPAEELPMPTSFKNLKEQTAWVARRAARQAAAWAARGSATRTATAAQWARSAGQTNPKTATALERQYQADLLREIFGNPFRPVTVKPMLTWRDGTIPALAQTIYDERELPAGLLDTKRLAILADALEEAGCTNEDVLSHLRGPGPHVRGCRVVDLLLVKE